MGTRSLSTVCYLYGFTDLDAPSPPDGLEGLEERPVQLLDLEGFRAVYSLLPAELYGEEAVAEHLSDLRWITPRGLLHETVVTWFVDRGGILPASFLTLYSSVDALAADARSRSDRIGELLAGVARKRQWDLKVSYDKERLTPQLGEHSAEIHALDEDIALAAPGKRYLLERKRSTLVARIMRDVAARLARGLLQTLAEHAEEVRMVPLPKEAQGSAVVLHAALLADPSTSDDLLARIGEERGAFEDRGLEIAFSGPWAPYRFVEREGGAGNAAPRAEAEEGGRE